MIATQHHEPSILEQGKMLLFMPNLLSYFLTGGINCDITMAAASLLFNPNTRNWHKPLLSLFGLPDLLPDISPAGRIIGHIAPHITEQSGMPAIPVISVAQHDTISAILTIEAKNKANIAYICCGTWSVVGTSISAPLINEQVFKSNFMNEPGYGQGGIFFVKYVTGLWILQECMREWENKGFSLDWAGLQAAAEASKFYAVIDVEDSDFAVPGNMSRKVVAYCMKTGQQIPQNEIDLYKCIVTSLAIKYAEIIEDMKRLVGFEFSEIHLVGGGSRNSLLCRLTARHTGMRVVAGPHEASVVGNTLMQLEALGEIANIREASQVLLNSFASMEYYE